MGLPSWFTDFAYLIYLIDTFADNMKNYSLLSV